MTAVAVRFQELKDLGVEFWAISTDTVFTHKAWQEKELSQMVPGGMPYPMLSDQAGKIGRLYGVYDEESGLDKRGRFLIDPDGILVAMEILQDAVGRNVGELLRQVKACQHVRNTQEATPANWEPGKTALKPGAEMVGRVCDFWSPD